MKFDWFYMFYNIVCEIIHISSAKVLLFFGIKKYFCIFFHFLAKIDIFTDSMDGKSSMSARPFPSLAYISMA